MLTLTTPPVLSLVGWLVTALRGGRHILWEMDVYPDIAVELGVLRAESWLTRGLGWALDAVRRRAAGVIVLGESMRERLLRHGVPAERLHVAENWADGSEIQPRAFPDRQVFEVLYSGNLGLAHDLETVCGALERLRGGMPREVSPGGRGLGGDSPVNGLRGDSPQGDSPRGDGGDSPQGDSPRRRFRFTFAGGGPQRGALERFCGVHGFQGEFQREAQGTVTEKRVTERSQPWRAGAALESRPTRTRVEFKGYSARHELAASLAGCHVGLVTQKACTVGAVVPSKVYGLLAAGRPILYVGPAQGTPARLIAKFGCGWQVEPGDAAGLVRVLQRLAQDFGEVEAAGARGYRAFQEFYDRKAGVGRIVGIVVGRDGAAEVVPERAG